MQSAFGKKTQCLDLFKNLIMEREIPLDLPGTKTLKIISLISSAPSSERFVIFCNWREEVRLLHESLRVSGIPSLFMTGKMSMEDKEVVIEEFDEEPSFRALICTTGSGSIGLNLQMADHVIVTSPQFDEFVERQAFSRVDRKGQQKKTRMHRLVIKDTIDEVISSQRL
jgi:transcription termination factor 2